MGAERVADGLTGTGGRTVASAQEMRVEATAVVATLFGVAPRVAAAKIVELTKAELGQVLQFRDRLQSLQEELAQVLDGARERIEQDALQCW